MRQQHSPYPGARDTRLDTSKQVLGTGIDSTAQQQHAAGICATDSRRPKQQQEQQQQHANKNTARVQQQQQQLFMAHGISRLHQQAPCTVASLQPAEPVSSRMHQQAACTGASSLKPSEPVSSRIHQQHSAQPGSSSSVATEPTLDTPPSGSMPLPMHEGCVKMDEANEGAFRLLSKLATLQIVKEGDVFKGQLLSATFVNKSTHVARRLQCCFVAEGDQEAQQCAVATGSRSICRLPTQCLGYLKTVMQQRTDAQEQAAHGSNEANPPSHRHSIHFKHCDLMACPTCQGHFTTTFAASNFYVVDKWMRDCNKARKCVPLDFGNHGASIYSISVALGGNFMTLDTIRSALRARGLVTPNNYTEYFSKTGMKDPHVLLHITGTSRRSIPGKPAPVTGTRVPPRQGGRPPPAYLDTVAQRLASLQAAGPAAGTPVQQPSTAPCRRSATGTAAQQSIRQPAGAPVQQPAAAPFSAPRSVAQQPASVPPTRPAVVQQLASASPADAAPRTPVRQRQHLSGAAPESAQQSLSHAPKWSGPGAPIRQSSCVSLTTPVSGNPAQQSPPLSPTTPRSAPKPSHYPTLPRKRPHHRPESQPSSGRQPQDNKLHYKPQHTIGSKQSKGGLARDIKMRLKRRRGLARVPEIPYEERLQPDFTDEQRAQAAEAAAGKRPSHSKYDAQRRRWHKRMQRRIRQQTRRKLCNPLHGQAWHTCTQTLPDKVLKIISRNKQLLDTISNFASSSSQPSLLTALQSAHEQHGSIPRFSHVLFMPSKGRAEVARTKLSALSSTDTVVAGGVLLVLVVEEQDAEEYAARLGPDDLLLVLSDNNKGIGHVREVITWSIAKLWRLNEFVMMDDNVVAVLERSREAEQIASSLSALLTAFDNIPHKFRYAMVGAALEREQSWSRPPRSWAGLGCFVQKLTWVNAAMVHELDVHYQTEHMYCKEDVSFWQALCAKGAPALMLRAFIVRRVHYKVGGCWAVKQLVEESPESQLGKRKREEEEEQEQADRVSELDSDDELSSDALETDDGTGTVGSEDSDSSGITDSYTLAGSDISSREKNRHQEGSGEVGVHGRVGIGNRRGNTEEGVRQRQKQEAEVTGGQVGHQQDRHTKPGAQCSTSVLRSQHLGGTQGAGRAIPALNEHAGTQQVLHPRSACIPPALPSAASAPMALPSKPAAVGPALPSTAVNLRPALPFKPAGVSPALSSTAPDSASDSPAIAAAAPLALPTIPVHTSPAVPATSAGLVLPDLPPLLDWRAFVIDSVSTMRQAHEQEEQQAGATTKSGTKRGGKEPVPPRQEWLHHEAMICEQLMRLGLPPMFTCCIPILDQPASITSNAQPSTAVMQRPAETSETMGTNRLSPGIRSAQPSSGLSTFRPSNAFTGVKASSTVSSAKPSLAFDSDRLPDDLAGQVPQPATPKQARAVSRSAVPQVNPQAEPFWCCPEFKDNVMQYAYPKVVTQLLYHIKTLAELVLQHIRQEQPHVGCMQDQQQVVQHGKLAVNLLLEMLRVNPQRKGVERTVSQLRNYIRTSRDVKMELLLSLLPLLPRLKGMASPSLLDSTIMQECEYIINILDLDKDSELIHEILTNNKDSDVHKVLGVKQLSWYIKQLH